MESFIESLVALLRPPWNYVAGVVALILLNADKLIDFSDRWRSSYTKMKELEHEKLLLEVMLLRRQLKDTVTEHGPQVSLDIAGDSGPIAIDPRPSVANVIQPRPTSAAERTASGRVRRFVAGYPRFGRTLMLLAQILLGPLMAFMALGTIGIVIVGFEDPELGVGGALLLAAIYGAFTWLAYRGFRSAALIRKTA